MNMINHRQKVTISKTLCINASELKNLKGTVNLSYSVKVDERFIGQILKYLFVLY